MRRLLLILILTLSFQILSKADDIKDFQIEGISVGDSLLDFYNEDKILNANKDFATKSKKFHRINFMLNDSGNYDAIAFYIKTNDKSYIVYSLEGFKFEKYVSCKKIQKKIANELRIFFSNAEEDSYETKHNLDIESDSIFYSFDFNLKDGNTARVICTNWSKKMEENDYDDSLSVYLYNLEFSNWLDNEAYK